MKTMDSSDADLVAQSLAGDRDAFGQIVARHQSLLCSLAYSATGSLSHSEDLAQETFVTAWKQLANLREPEKLRSWLCRISRNLTYDALRKHEREPSHRAESLEEIPESHSPGALPTEQTISNEEQAILWRSLERIPEIYREPLVLFYREHQSIEAVAQKLELTEDAVKQRLSRGRKMLQEQVLAFVEGALERTNPGKAFTLAVVASLPALTFSAKAAAIGATAVKGSTTAKAVGAMGLLGMFWGPLVVLGPNYLGYRIGLAEARSEAERSHIKTFYRKISIIVLGLFLPFAAIVLWLTRNQTDRSYLSGLFATGLVLIFLPTMIAFVIASSRKRREYYSKVLAEEYGGVFPKPAWEYRSKLILFGLPLVHIRIGDRFDLLQKPVTAWIAVANYAVGGLFAFGGLAIAPLSIGGLAIGGLSFGGLSLGVFVFGGIALGVCAFGGLALGWQAFGCLAIAWNAAAGDFAVAHDFALGRLAHAAQANNDLARQFIESNSFSRCAQFIDHHWLWINLLWIVPLFIQWQVTARHKQQK